LSFRIGVISNMLGRIVSNLIRRSAKDGAMSDEKMLSAFEEITKYVDANHINGHFVKPLIQRQFENLGYHLIKDHFYSPVPSVFPRAEQDAVSQAFPFLSAFGSGDYEEFDKLLKRVLAHKDDLRELPRVSDQGFYWNNPMFPPLDAIAYYGLILEIQPRRVIEIGCGFSTEISLLASRKLSGLQIECIEPYPSERFKRIVPEVSKFNQNLIQNVHLDKFKELNSGDILFIDTSHVSKRASDVNYILFNIIPTLKPGVLVHVHDIFLPYDYPDHWLYQIGIMWNEQYLIAALLMAGGRYRPVLPVFYLSQCHKDYLRRLLDGFDIWDLSENLGGAQGASMWFEVC
jgi:hypothetical protein